MKVLPAMTPHTLAKHRILKRYLDAWFPILGSRHSELLYIDGFAGPGEYKNGEVGSPLLAIQSASDLLKCGRLKPGIKIHMVFVEATPDYYEHLCTRLGEIAIPPQIRIAKYLDEFSAAMADSVVRSLSASVPTFAFVDPFGFKGIPFGLIHQILSNPRCEVFINIMADFVNRFLEHPNERVVAHVPEAFGTQEVLRIPAKATNRTQALLDLYESQLNSAAKYVGRFDMKDARNKLLYALYFASNSPAGFEKMKDAMWNVDSQEGGLFSDLEPDGAYQLKLFTLEPLKSAITEKYRGRAVPIEELQNYTCQRTKFLSKHLRIVLNSLEHEKRIRVHSIDRYKRRPGTYKTGYVRIEFLD